uniref:Uncharacterized protein n=1 Tax=Romanomermis culicivorax TaxID=13658 RepID=A0A915IRG2_ROMCU
MLANSTKYAINEMQETLKKFRLDEWKEKMLVKSMLFFLIDISRGGSHLHGSHLPRKAPAFLDIIVDKYHHNPLDELHFEMSQNDDEIWQLKVRIDEMTHSMIGVRGLLEKFIMDQRKKDIQMKSDILDADEEPNVQSVQVDEEDMELEIEEEADSALLGEESYKQVDNEDAL